MTNPVFGRVSWGEKVKTGGGGNDFIRLSKDGSFEFRILGPEAFAFASHWAKDASGNGKTVRCAGKDCILCKEGNKIKIVYAIEAYFIDEKRAGILQVPSQAYGGLQTLANNPKFGDPRKYNIMITRDKARAPSAMYTVNFIGREALEPDAIAKCNEFMDKKLDLNKLCGSMTNDEILRRLNRIPDSNSSSGFGGATGASTEAGGEETEGGSTEGPWNF